jgi:hypothetical protein
VRSDSGPAVFDAAALNALANEAIIQTSPGVFLDPRQAFWQPTRLGRWASQLPHEMRRYQDFLDGIGVAEEPTASELDFILKLIADDVGTNRLEPEDELVIYECWAMLDSLLRVDPATARTLKLIGRRRSFPDRRGVLARPERLIFRDPRKLVDQIELLVNEVIDRERRTQRALEFAGVTKAEDVIEVDPVDVVSARDTEMRSYVLFGDDSDHGTTGDESPDALDIDRAGVDRVLAYERARGRKPEEQSHENAGFDVLSRGKGGDVARRIEIKSIRGEWTVRGVMLSSRQFREATEHGDEFWLYVVENAEDDDLYRIHRIQGPANRVDFFGFDNGWAALREPEVELDEQGASAVRSTRSLLGRSPGHSTVD